MFIFTLSSRLIFSLSFDVDPIQQLHDVYVFFPNLTVVVIVMNHDIHNKVD